MQDNNFTDKNIWQIVINGCNSVLKNDAAKSKKSNEK